MIDQILSVIDPTQYYNNTINLFFPKADTGDEIVLTKDEKSLIVKQINEVKTHINYAKQYAKDENFSKAVDEVEKAMDASTCSNCRMRMAVHGHVMNFADSVCPIDDKMCEKAKKYIDDAIDDFTNNYLPRVEDVLKAREV